MAREGGDVTIVALSRMVGESLAAAERLAADGVEAEVIDPRTLVPLDLETIVESVRRTNRLVVAHEAVEHGGFGAEVAAAVQAAAFDFLDAPIERVGAPFAPVPFSPSLEDAYLPGADDVRSAVAEGGGMRAALLSEYGRPLELVDLPEPEIARPDELLLRIEGAGVCATDLHAIEGEMEPAGVRLPLVLGHENTGTRRGGRATSCPRWPRATR